MMHDDFDTQISPEETSEYGDYVAAEELEAIEHGDYRDDLIADEYDIMDEFADDEYAVEFEDDIDSFEEMANQYDDSRDLDFYES